MGEKKPTPKRKTAPRPKKTPQPQKRNATSFQPGNRFWFNRETFGRPMKYTPDEWLQKLTEYFEVAATRTWEKIDVIKGGDKAGMLVSTPVAEPLTRQSLLIFTGISKDTLNHYVSDKPSYADFVAITKAALEIIDNNQITGAALGFFNPLIISRLQGLRDGIDTDITSKGKQIKGSNIDLSKLSTDVLRQIADAQIIEPDIDEPADD